MLGEGVAKFLNLKTNGVVRTHLARTNNTKTAIGEIK
jgi:hypothetical protein